MTCCSGVTSRVDASGVRPVLFVHGDTANDGAGVAHLTPLEIAVTGHDGATPLARNLAKTKAWYDYAVRKGSPPSPLVERGLIHIRIGIVAAFGFVIAAALFAGDLTLRQYAGHGLFPMAAPTGGTLLILSWLAVAVAAAWPRPR